MRELRDVVDRFVLLEAARTFQVGEYVHAVGACLTNNDGFGTVYLLHCCDVSLCSF